MIAFVAFTRFLSIDQLRAALVQFFRHAVRIERFDDRIFAVIPAEEIDSPAAIAAKGKRCPFASGFTHERSFTNRALWRFNHAEYVALSFRAVARHRFQR